MNNKILKKCKENIPNENLIKICSNFANFRSLKRIYTDFFKANNEKKATLQGAHIPLPALPPTVFLQVRRGDEEEGRGRQARGLGCAVNSHMEIYLQHIRMLSAFRSIFNRVRSPCGLSGFPKRVSQCVWVRVCVWVLCVHFPPLSRCQLASFALQQIWLKAAFCNWHNRSARDQQSKWQAETAAKAQEEDEDKDEEEQVQEGQISDLY